MAPGGTVMPPMALGWQREQTVAHEQRATDWRGERRVACIEQKGGEAARREAVAPPTGTICEAQSSQAARTSPSFAHKA